MLDTIPRKSVFDAILACKNEGELIALIDDLLAPIEIKRANKRWDIAQSRLSTDCSQNEIISYHRASQGLAKRVIQELDKKRGIGYRLVYKRLFGIPLDERKDNA